MPGVEPGSEVNESKPTTCVFDLQGLTVAVTDRQVRLSQHQWFLALGPGARLHASLFEGNTEAEGNRHPSVRWHSGLSLGGHAITEVIASCCSPVVLTSSTSVARHASS